MLEGGLSLKHGVIANFFLSFDSFALIIESYYHSAVFVNEFALSVIFSSFETSFVSIAIIKHIETLPFKLTISKLTFVDVAVAETEPPFS